MGFESQVQYVMLYDAVIRKLGRHQTDKLLAIEMDFWRKAAREAKMEKISKRNIREFIEAHHNIVEVA